MPQPAYTARASGILTPTATLDREAYTMPEADFKKLHRLMRFAREYGLLVRYHCERCKGAVRLRREDRIVTELDGGQEAPGGHLRLFCDCASWQVKDLGPKGR